MKTVIKPWGKEEWLELNDRYCYKRIYLNKGYKTSFQYHHFKYETNYIISGEAEIWLENDEGIIEKKIMRAGEYYNVSPPKKHRVIAITDLIMQEVSTPEVDDVIRIEDDTNRKDGKIDGEHKKPAVLILASGLGTRLGTLTTNLNKALLPIDNRAIISRIIGKFPPNYDFVITKGYKGDAIEEYCRLVYPNYNFTFVEIDKIVGEGSGPGYSALKCRNELQRPFYITTCDCLIDTKLPHLDGNWVGVSETSYPEKYSTTGVDNDDNVVSFMNKNENGHNLAFIGLASIFDYEVFWNELEKNMINGELVSAFENPSTYPKIKVKRLRWFDTGNLDDLNKAKERFSDNPLSLHKETDEITYKEGYKFLKFIPNKKILSNKLSRAEHIKHLIPKNFASSPNFLSYDWEEGVTLYELDDITIYEKFLDSLKRNIKNGKLVTPPSDSTDIFYRQKTQQRLELFLKKYGDNYFNSSYKINGVEYPAMKELFEKIDFQNFVDNPFYSNFHGDLQFANVIYNYESDGFKYIDWRESFAGYTDGGDIYYDLAKLYGGLLISYNLMKDETNIVYTEGTYNIIYSYNHTSNLIRFQNTYINWLVELGFDVDKVKLLTAIIYINMSPLHDEQFGKMLWFKSIEMLYEHFNK